MAAESMQSDRDTNSARQQQMGYMNRESSAEAAERRKTDDTTRDETDRGEVVNKRQVHFVTRYTIDTCSRVREVAEKRLLLLSLTICSMIYNIKC